MHEKIPYTIHPDGSIEVKKLTGNERITGTTLAAIAGRSPWDTEFGAACKILGIYETPDNDRMRMGRYLEPEIIKFMNLNGLNVVPAKQLFGGDMDDETAYSEWKHHFDNAVFGGHIDGQIPDDGAIVEIKTTSRLDYWIKDGKLTPPEYYHIQASLYARMFGTDRIVFAVAVVGDDAVKEPSRYVLDGNVYVCEVAPHPEIDEIMEQAEEWYDTFVKLGLTPPPELTNKRDVDIMQSIRTRYETTDDLVTTIDRIDAIKNEIERIERAYLANLNDELDALVSGIKNDVDFGQDMKVVFTTSKGIEYNLSKSYRSTWDEKRMVIDGINVEQYKNLTESIRFERSRKKVR